MLLLDVGNSAIKAQWWFDKELKQTFSARYVPGWPSRFTAFLAEIKVENCYYSSVQKNALESDLLGSLNQLFPTSNMHKITDRKSVV